MSTAVSQSELSMFKLLLGALEARDDGGKTVHASDFASAINQLGHNFGQPFVDKVVTMCKLDAEGFVNFDKLEREVARMKQAERCSSPTHEKTHYVENFQVVEQTDIRKREAKAKQQSIAVRDNREALARFFRNYERGRMSADELAAEIEKLGITLTTDARALLRLSGGDSEVTFSKFARALTLPDFHTLKDAAGTPTTGHKNFTECIQQAGMEEICNKYLNDCDKHRKKCDPNRNRSVIAEIPNAAKPYKTHRRNFLHVRGPSKIAEHLRDRDWTPHEPPPISCNTEEAAHGILLKPGAKTTSETKLLRQQLIACARKLEIGQMTASQFVDKMYSLGVEISHDGLTILENFERVGQVNYVEFLRLFDRYIETNTVDTVNEVQVKKILEKFKSGCFQSISDLQSLAEVFRRIDRDHSGSLSFSEFKKAIRELRLDLSDDEVKTLYLYFDLDGNGTVSYDELLLGVRGQLSKERLHIVTTVFRKLDKIGHGYLLAEDAKSLYRASGHPDVVDGKRSAQDVFEEFVETFDSYTQNDGKVTWEAFLDYYSNLGGLINDDDYFEEMIHNTWQLDPLPPPPPSWIERKGKVMRAPLAAQSHGDVVSWYQKASALETRAQHLNRSAKSFVKRDSRSPIKWDQPHTKEVEERAFHKHLGGSRRRIGMPGYYGTDFITWDAAKGGGGQQDNDDNLDEASTPPPAPAQPGQTIDPHEIWSKRWRSQRTALYGTQPPFGVDPPVAATRRGKKAPLSTNKAMSLQDLMSQKAAAAAT